MQEILKKKMRHTFSTFGNKDAEKGGTYKTYTCGSAIRQLAGSLPRQVQCSATMSFGGVYPMFNQQLTMSLNWLSKSVCTAALFSISAHTTIPLPKLTILSTVLPMLQSFLSEPTAVEPWAESCVWPP